MAVEDEFFIWIFEEFLYDYIYKGSPTFDIVFSSTEKIVHFPNKAFKWFYEVDEQLPHFYTYTVRSLMMSPIFQKKAKESLSYWYYDCDIGFKDLLGLRCYLKATKNVKQ